MKRIILLFSVGLFILSACGTSKNTTGNSETPVEKSLDDKNRVTISLLNQIRRLPGIVVKGGIPFFNKANNSMLLEGSQEPLYVLNGYIIGTSFRSIDQLVDNVNVAKIEALYGSDAAEYGSRSANGVIRITTK
ncbi:MAG: TonB-dependent receptor plug domain-containing protein [Eudoraea sp.]|nr:TonB-dependent receptor plug domain-containing protein [Eudoraea sp.]